MSVRLLWTAGAGALLLMLLSLGYCLAFLPQLLSAGEPGFQWEYNARTRRMMVTGVELGSKAAAAGLRAGMRILAIQGREPAPMLNLWSPPVRRVLQPGDRLAIDISRPNGYRRLQWPVEE
jgi:predicted metalloprotease with PDZ domain